MLDAENQAFIHDPYPFYRKLQEQSRLYFQPSHEETVPDRWFLSHYDDVVHVLKDKRFGRENEANVSSGYTALEAVNRGVMLHRDPPDHTRLRSLVSKAFTPAMVAQLRPNIEQICDELLDVMEEKQDVDLIADLAMPLPVMVISDMLGVPKEDRVLIKNWSHVLAGTLEPGITPANETDGMKAGMEFIQYLQDIFEQRNKHPKDDLITSLLQVEEAGETLSRSELYATCILLLAAGHETTTNLIGNGLFTLWKHQDELSKLRADPELTPSAVEEILRYEPPIQRTGRFAQQDVELYGKQIKKGQLVVTLLAAANRDPKQFTDPERFDISRQPNRQIGFGMGIHYCLGAPLARLEGDIVFRKLLSRFSSLDINVSNPEWNRMVIFRGLKKLPGTVC
ncbi:cytochrome P450 [Pueribacillus theae]|uniref:Cytochrome P450 n=1 Tax=Pueribacillus theae TaxID=2171751 RepID=A0A2U1K7Z3_9BACI|nr:cytochrome P450 [Pueribacillus theae]PWA13038.1 cytochrome P450 [Pueribacillus theae]